MDIAYLQTPHSEASQIDLMTMMASDQFSDHPPSMEFFYNAATPPAVYLPPSSSSEDAIINSRGAVELSFGPDRRSSVAAMREMIFRMAAMQPVQIDPETVKPPKRRNVRISKDPQSVAARHRRERISERIRILQRLVPGGTKMDTASMLDEAIHYVKFLKTQVQSLERAAATGRGGGAAAAGLMAGVGFSEGNYSCLGRIYEDQGFMNSGQMLS